MKQNEYIEQMKELDSTALVAKGFDDCIIGIAHSFDKGYFFIYSEKKIIDTLQKEHNMSEEEAIEYYEYNIAGAYMGEKMPAFMIEMESYG